MITVDLVLTREDGWVEVPLTNSKMIIAVKSSDGVLMRFGAGSNSSGFRLEEGSVVVLEETVWLKDVYDNGTSVVAVSQ